MNKIIFVMGMHRSGTSAMTGVLEKLGCYSGEESELLAADRNNELGYFERKDVVDCNEAILSELFLNRYPETTKEGWFEDVEKLDMYAWVFGAWANIKNDKPSGSLMDEIDKCLEKLNQNKPDKECAVVIKDPRISLTYPYWEKKSGSKNPVIIMIRNPEDVMNSLYKRNNINKGLANDLWERYTYSSLNATKSNPRIIINYDDFIDNTEEVLDTVIKFIEESGIKINKERRNDCLNLVKPNLRHQQNEDKNFSANLIYKSIVNGNYKLIEESPVLKDEYGWEKGLMLPFLLKNKTLEYRIVEIKKHKLIGRMMKIINLIRKNEPLG